MPRILGPWRIRRRKQSSFYARIIEFPPRGKNPFFVSGGLEKFIDLVRRSFMPYLLIVGSELEQQLLILAQKRRRVGYTFIPHQYQPTIRPEDPGKLALRCCSVEPMCGLSRGHKINRPTRQATVFG